MYSSALYVAQYCAVGLSPPGRPPTPFTCTCLSGHRDLDMGTATGHRTAHGPTQGPRLQPTVAPHSDQCTATVRPTAAARPARLWHSLWAEGFACGPVVPVATVVAPTCTWSRVMAAKSLRVLGSLLVRTPCRAEAVAPRGSRAAELGRESLRITAPLLDVSMSARAPALGGRPLG